MNPRLLLSLLESDQTYRFSTKPQLSKVINTFEKSVNGTIALKHLLEVLAIHLLIGSQLRG